MAWRVAALAAALAALAAAGGARAAGALPLGADPARAGAYAAEPFACLDGRGAGVVNDDFCDCADGSDEPGTAACAGSGGAFRCENAGYEAALVSAARVGDGVCDCCDGTDEPKGMCGNTCDKELAERVAAATAELAVYADGLAARKGIIAASAAKVADWKATAAGSQEAVGAAEAWKAEAERRYELVEQREESGDVGEPEGPEAEEAPDECAEDDADEPTEETEVERAKRIAMQWGAKTGDDDEDGAAADCAGACSSGAIGADDWDDEAVAALAPLVRNASAAKPEEWSDEDDGPWEQPTVENPRFAELKRRTAADCAAAEEKLKALKAERKSAQDLLVRHFKGEYGADSELAALAGECLKGTVDAYEYELCPFDKAVQVERDHHSRRTNLGKWAGYETDANGIVSAMHFDGGVPCPNGVARKVDATLVCGATQAVLSVEEPNMCEYVARVSTPLACSEGGRAELEAFLAEHAADAS